MMERHKLCSAFEISFDPVPLRAPEMQIKELAWCILIILLLHIIIHKGFPSLIDLSISWIGHPGLESWVRIILAILYMLHWYSPCEM